MSTCAAPDNPLLLDTNVITGQLANGLTFYIRPNRNPPARLELRLVVRAGSIVEDDDQQGLAHMIEHLAFQDTAQFPDQTMISRFEAEGVVFGRDLNAFTRFDATVYRLHIPTDRPHLLDMAFQAVSAWSSGLKFTPGIIEKERRILLEEHRIQRSQGYRQCQKKHRQVLLHGSRYAERFPIGDQETLQSFTDDALKRYYQDWYRPDLMAVIAVGDVSPEVIRHQLEATMGQMQRFNNAKTRPDFSIPATATTRFSILSNSEVTLPELHIHWMRSALPPKTTSDYRLLLLSGLCRLIINQRLSEMLVERTEMALVEAEWRRKRLTRSQQSFLFDTRIATGTFMTGFVQLITEIERLRQHGLTAAELERHKRNLLREFEQEYAERHKLSSASFATEYERHFIYGEPTPGVEAEFRLHQELLPTITLDEVNDFLLARISGPNQTVLITLPETSPEQLPQPAELQKVMQDIQQQKVSPYTENQTKAHAKQHSSNNAKVEQYQHHPELDLHEILFENGLRVLLKQTPFQADQILFSAYQPGGHSRADDVEFISSRHAASIVSLSGFGDYTFSQLQKYLSGKIVSLTPYIDSVHHGFYGQCSPRDLESQLHLIELAMRSPRHSENACQAFKNRLMATLENRKSNPEAVFWDTITRTLTRNHFRGRPMMADMIAQIDSQQAFDFYQRCFENARGFTFLFVGNIDLAQAEQLIPQYLAHLPAHKKSPIWRDVGINYVSGVVEKTIHMGQAEQSYQAINFHGDFEWSPRNVHALASLANLLQIRLRETIRDQAGLAYQIQVTATSRKFPTPRYLLTIFFTCDPSHSAQIEPMIFDIIHELRNQPVASDLNESVRVAQQRSREVGLRSNQFWLNELFFFDFHTGTFDDFIGWERFITQFDADDLLQAADLFLNPEQYLTVKLVQKA